MKKALFVLLLVTLVAFSGCALMPKQNSKPSSLAPSSQGESSAAPVASAAPTEIPAESSKEKPSITAETAIKAFGEYSDFEHFWYMGGNSSAMTKEIIRHGDMNYCRYETKEIKNFAAFQEKALSMMTEEVFAALQKRITYIDQDGALYGPLNYGAGDSSAFAGNESEAIKISDNEYEVKVGHYYFASAFNANAAPDAKVLTGETTCKYIHTDSGWKFSAIDYQSKNTFAG
ncbi:MAG: hypothetical protein RSC76_08635 [Oscillospiraceae bacterium]